MANTTQYFGKTDLLYLITLINTEINKYVAKVSGKGLSTEDFTTDLKTKLDGIDLTKYSTTDEMVAAINAAVGSITGIKFETYPTISDLPTTGVNGVIYLVPNSGSGNNVKDEYYWDDTSKQYELFGTTEIDLSDYIKKTDLVELTTDEVKAAWDSVFSPATP